MFKNVLSSFRIYTLTHNLWFGTVVIFFTIIISKEAWTHINILMVDDEYVIAAGVVVVVVIDDDDDDDDMVINHWNW